MPGPARLREQNRQRTIQAIQSAAVELFAERGFEQTTVDDIAAATGISPRTFFRYFPAKEDVLFADHPEQLRRLRAALAERRPGEPVLATVRRALTTAFQAPPGSSSELRLAKTRLIWTSPALRARSHQLSADYEQAVAEAIATALEPAPDARLRGQLAAGALLGLLRAAARAIHTLHPKDAEELINQGFDIVEGGLAKYLA